MDTLAFSMTYEDSVYFSSVWSESKFVVLNQACALEFESLEKILFEDFAMNGCERYRAVIRQVEFVSFLKDRVNDHFRPVFF